MSIRICHVTSVHPSKDARIFWKECLSLSKIYEVCLIAPNTEERYDHGVHIYNVNLPKGRFRRQRYLHLVLEKMIEVDADVYHFHDPELMRLGTIIKKRGKKIIFDSHEDVPMQILCKEYLPKITKKPLSWIYSIYERNYLKVYDAVISVTPTIVDRLRKINKNTFMVTNYPVLSEVKFAKSAFCGCNICFAGGVSERYMHDYILRALPRTQATYVLAGPSYPGYLEKLQRFEGWKQTNYLGIVNREKVYEIYKNSIAGVVLLDYTANVGYHKGSLGVLKLFEYMAAGIPVIATNFELWKEIVEGNECGICLDPHDIDAIVDSIIFYINNPKVAKLHGENGRKAIKEKYNWDSQERVLYSVYDSVLKIR